MTSQLDKVFKMQEQLDDPAAPSGQRANARQTLAQMAADWDAKNQDDIADRMLEYRDQNIGKRFTFAIYAVLAGLIPPLVYPIFVWLLAGFRKTQGQGSTEAAS
jgi:hypothetical protein